MWHAMPMGTNQLEYNVENLLTHQVMGIANASTATGATALQYADNGTNDHLWEFYLLTDGNYLIKNVNSGYYLEVSNSGTTSSAVIDQNARATTGTGCTCQEWKLAVSTTPHIPRRAPSQALESSCTIPYMLKDANGTYWLYGTHQTLAYSTDLTTFTYTTLTTPGRSLHGNPGGRLDYCRPALPNHRSRLRFVVRIADASDRKQWCEHRHLGAQHAHV